MTAMAQTTVDLGLSASQRGYADGVLVTWGVPRVTADSSGEGVLGCDVGPVASGVMTLEVSADGQGWDEVWRYECPQAGQPMSYADAPRQWQGSQQYGTTMTYRLTYESLSWSYVEYASGTRRAYSAEDVSQTCQLTMPEEGGAWGTRAQRSLYVPNQDPVNRSSGGGTVKYPGKYFKVDSGGALTLADGYFPIFVKTSTSGEPLLPCVVIDRTTNPVSFYFQDEG